MQLLDGNLCSEQIRQEITQKVDAIKASGQRAPHLAAVLVGNDGASENYVAFKVKDCAQVGYESTTIRLPDTVTEAYRRKQNHPSNRCEERCRWL